LTKWESWGFRGDGGKMEGFVKEICLPFGNTCWRKMACGVKSLPSHPRAGIEI
jgi:hypothetical protein